MIRAPLALGLFCLALAAPLAAGAQITGEPVTYEVDGETYQGYYAHNPQIDRIQPTVLILHDWDGLGDYERRRAEMLAEMGYAAFAADLYGKGVRPDTLEQKKARSGALYNDRAAMRARMAGALRQLDELPGADRDNAAAIGYCFGGSAVLELARSGRDLAGFVSFHGGLGTPEGQDYEAVTGEVLILHGSRDSVSGMADVADLAERMDGARVPYAMEIYGGARHAFTVWGGDRYHPRADLRSWDRMETFLDRVLR
jgi:dienelactone hydrolase